MLADFLMLNIELHLCCKKRSGKKCSEKKVCTDIGVLLYIEKLTVQNMTKINTFSLSKYMQSLMFHIIEMCSGITHGRVLNDELYAQRFQKLIYVHLFTYCFMVHLFITDCFI